MTTPRVSLGEAVVCSCGNPAEPSKGVRGPRRKRCSECQRAFLAKAQRKHRAKVGPDVAKCRELQRAYGITHEQYKLQLERQGGVCAICKEPERIAGRALAVDHCHATGAVRGLLCAMCNTGIGKLRDDPALVRSALSYLEKPQWQ